VSPWHVGAHAERRAALARRAAECGVPLVFVNRVGGQDADVFDGASCVLDASGAIAQQLPAWRESLATIELDAGAPRAVRGELEAALEPNLYAALVLALRDYVNGNGFARVVLGLSGGIDSALTLAIATDALGAARVHAVMLPSPYTSAASIEDARTMAGRLGVRYDELPIGPIFDAALDALGAEAGGAVAENLQARIRGMLLMALANRDGALVLATGNKSELAVGYATLYGDLAGGFAVLKDVAKHLVHDLARWRNALGEVVPARVLERPPSAELRPGQVDADELPPYDVVDAVVAGYVEEGRDPAALVAGGLPRDAVAAVIERIERQEFKRRQAPIGPRVTRRALGVDWRHPVTSAWTPPLG
jgi:NAD+ synthetase